MEEHYLDNSATTRCCPEAVAAAVELMERNFANPSSLHGPGFAAERALAAARADVAAVLHAAPEEVTFTSGGTEANNLALFGAAQARRKRGTRIVSTAIEHPSVAQPLAALEKEGFTVVRLQPDSAGRIAPAQLYQAVTPDTILVSLMAVNNEVGSVLPVEAAREAIASAGAPALLHVDAVQAFGKLPLHPERMGVDLLTVSAHKIHGPKGVGALYHRKGARLLPRALGGGQEHGLRAGTEAMPLIGAFAAACRALPDVAKAQAHVAALNAHLREGLAALPDVTVNSAADALPYVLNLSAGRVRAQTMLNFLSERGVYVSSGSACAKGADSPVLRAMGLPRARIAASLRVSFSRYNTQADCDAFLHALQEGLRVLQKA